MTTVHKLLFEKLPMAALLISSDTQIIRMNQKACELLPLACSTTGKPTYIADIIADSSKKRLFQHLNRLHFDEQSFTIAIKNNTMEQETVSILASLAEEDRYILLVQQQKTDSLPTGERLLLESQYNHSPAGILIVDRQMEMLSYNRNFFRLWNIPDHILKTKDDRACLRFALDQVDNPKQFMADIHALYQDHNLSQTDEIHLKDGRVFYRHTYPLRNQSTYLGRVWFFLDISDLHDTKERLNFMAHHDLLTGLPNRRLFHDLLRQNLARAQRNHKQVAILFLDLDNFKLINDCFGHQEGDDLLKHIAKILSGALRESDIICRWGGDEFVIALMDTGGMQSAEVVADKIRENVVNYAEQTYPGFDLGTSIGVSLYPDDSINPDRLIRNADTAMYMAKRTGKNRLHFFIDEEVRAIFSPGQ